MKPLITYTVEIENSPHCEWNTFINGDVCKRTGEFVIVGFRYKGEDLNSLRFHQGFHSAHLCKNHITPAWNTLIAEQVGAL